MAFLTTLKSRLPKKRWKRALLYTASTLFIALAIDMSLTAYWRRITISRETTFLTAPLLPEGTPDYITWLNDRAAEGVTPQNNAAVPLIQACGFSAGIGSDREPWKTRTLRALGFTQDHIVGKLLNFPEWARDQTKYGGKHPADAIVQWDPDLKKWSDEEPQMYHAPWKAEDHPFWAQWLAAQSEVLSLAHNAADRERYYMPALPKETPFHPGDTMGILLPTLGPTNSLGRMLISDAMMHAGDSDKHILLHDLTDALRLGALIRTQDPFLIGGLVGESIMQQACTATQAALASGDLDGQTARQLLAAMNALPPIPPIDLTDERMILLDLFCSQAVYGLGRSPLLGTARPTAAPLIAALVPVQFNAQLRWIKQHQDILEAAMRIPSYAQRAQAVDAAQRELFAGLNRSVLVFSGYLQDSESQDVLIWGPRACAELQTPATQRDLTKIALALAVYRSTNNAYPPTLDALSKILTPIPLDGFTDQPFLYRPEKSGYLLYSVGKDLHDDGGNPEKDLVIHLEN